MIWSRDVDFAPLTYAGDVYALTSRTQCLQLVIGDSPGHNLALLVVPVLLAAAALAWTRPLRLVTRAWRRGAVGVNLSQALNIWIIQIVIAAGRRSAASFSKVYIKTDWGISLFSRLRRRLVAIPALRLPGIALFHIAAIWLVSRSPPWPDRRSRNTRWREIRTAASGYGARSATRRAN